ncbi:hypothetical protein [Ornithobacterium rhinotracheale]|nr:hypothetical protein [Ornithobacterium rhinotracheale]MCK0206078.1 hypothetical protein [Ornithobacterium rhinotracheale]
MPMFCLSTTAAYNNGEMAEAVKEYIEQNILYLDQYLKSMLLKSKP